MSRVGCFLSRFQIWPPNIDEHQPTFNRPHANSFPSTIPNNISTRPHRSISHVTFLEMLCTTCDSNCLAVVSQSRSRWPCSCRLGDYNQEREIRPQPTIYLRVEAFYLLARSITHLLDRDIRLSHTSSLPCITISQPPIQRTFGP